LIILFYSQVAKSGCYIKSDFVIDSMMSARHSFAAKDCSVLWNKGTSPQYGRFIELSLQECQFKEMCNEFRLTMDQPDSALRLFLKHSPDCVDRLLNKCLVSGDGDCEGQVGGSGTLRNSTFDETIIRKVADNPFHYNLSRSRSSLPYLCLQV
jgi:hypothetical protein